MIRRAYISVNGRNIHFRWCGSGAPIILLHASPQSSSAMETQLTVYGAVGLAIALDTPGYGCSDPLPLMSPTITDYAHSLSETLDALKIEKAAFFSRHTGVSIAIEFSLMSPERVSGLICDGLPIYTDDLKAEYLARYIEPIASRWDAAHLVSLWFRFREQHVFWPWFKQQPQARADADTPSADELHIGALNMLLSGSSSGLAELAVFRYDMAQALTEVSVPVTIATRPGDSLFRRMALLENLPDNIHILRMERNACYLAEEEHRRLYLESLDQDYSLPAEPASFEKRTKHFVDYAGGQIALRTIAGRRGAKWLLLLPVIPGGAEFHEDLITALAKNYNVVAMDPPSCGDTTIVCSNSPLDDYENAAKHVKQNLNQGLSILGFGAGALIADRIADEKDMLHRYCVPDQQTARLLLDTPSALPDLTPDSYGLHLVKAWHYLRDKMLWRETKLGRREGIVNKVIDLRELQRKTLSLMKHPTQVNPLLQAYYEEAVEVNAPAKEATLSEIMDQLRTLQ